MHNPELTYSNTEFPIFKKLESGQWLYFFNRSWDKENGYTAICLKFPAKPSYNECVEQVIRKYLTVSEEFDLINSAYLGNDAKYREWLNKLSEIKINIKNDFKESE